MNALALRLRAAARLGWQIESNWADPLKFVVYALLRPAATLFLGYVIAGLALVLPRSAITLNEGVGVGLFLLCGVIFPVDLLPHGLREVALALPFTYWYESLRRFLLGRTASAMFSHWPD